MPEKSLEEKINDYNKLKEEVGMIEMEFERIYTWESNQNNKDKFLSESIKKHIETGRELTEEQKKEWNDYDTRFYAETGKKAKNSLAFRVYRQKLEDKINERGLFNSDSKGDKFVRNTLETAKTKEDFSGVAVFPDVKKEKLLEMNKLFLEINAERSKMKETDMSPAVKNFENETINDVSEVKALGKTKYAWKTTKMMGNAIAKRKIKEGVVQLKIASNIQNVRKESSKLQETLSKMEERNERNNQFAKPIDGPKKVREMNNFDKNMKPKSIIKTAELKNE